MPHIIIVEDDPAVGESLRLALSALGHTACTAASAEEALALIDSTPFDLAVVDVMLPGMDGFELCRRVSATRSLPLLLLTARSDPIDIVVGLECGADDYVTKPVEPRVLDARIKAVLRRSAPITGGERVERLGGLVVDEAAMRITKDGSEVSLTPTELRLLLELVHHAGQALSRRTLLEQVWDYGYVGDARLVDACVQRLRSKIEDDPTNPTLIRTVRGIGYRLERP